MHPWEVNVAAKLPDKRTNPEREGIHQGRVQYRKEKARQKLYKGGKSNVRPHNIKERETILLERRLTRPTPHMILNHSQQRQSMAHR